MTRFALALSHLPHKCSGGDIPIQKVTEALLWIKNVCGTLITSQGSLNWDIQLSLAISLEIPVELIVSEQKSDDQWFSLLSKEYNFLRLPSITTVSSQIERDQLLFKEAEMILPIWCRKNGRMVQYLSTLDYTKCDYRFSVNPFSFKNRSKYSVNGINEKINTLPAHYLWHWSRSCDGPWPNETISHFCHSLIECSRYPHSALDTLKRILEEKQICGSGKFSYQNTPVVSFTENHPALMMEHFIWRAGHHRMNFEPYAIGFPQEILEKKGAVPVRYNEEPAWDSLTSGEQWKNEKEWRILDSLYLDDDLMSQAIVIVRKPSECESISHPALYHYELE